MMASRAALGLARSLRTRESEAATVAARLSSLECCSKAAAARACCSVTGRRLTFLDSIAGGGWVRVG